MMEKLNRYPGAKSFTTEQAALFKGRKEDTERFYQLIYTQPLVVLYGKSGCGKSSLINAGIIPIFQQKLNTSRHLNIRLYNKQQGIEKDVVKSPLARLIEALKQECGGVELPWMEQFKQNATPNGILWYWLKQVQHKVDNATVFLFFDQFEELFTYTKEEIDLFAIELGIVLYQKIPHFFLEADYFTNLTPAQSDFVYTNPDLRIVFSIRADNISFLNRLSRYLPNILKHHYELDAISEADAKKAITEPAHLEGDFKTAPFEYEEKTVNAIIAGVKNKETGKIETATLQIICRDIEDTKVEALNGKPISPTILGNITDIFSDYYQNSLKELSTQERNLAAEVIEKKFIQNNQRIPFEANHLKQEYHLTGQILDQLEKSTLLRKEQDGVGRAIYEIGHDTLVEPILVFSKVREEEEKRYLEVKRIESIQKNQERNRTRLYLIGGVFILFILWYHTQKSKTELNQKINNLYLSHASYLTRNGDILKGNGKYVEANYAYDSAIRTLDNIPIFDTTGMLLKAKLLKVRNSQ